jgi:hypothetical protein
MTDMEVGWLLVQTAFACTVLGIVLSVGAYLCRPKYKDGELESVSQRDRGIYEGKHVMIDSLLGIVVASGATTKEVFSTAALFNQERRKYFVHVYIPRRDEVLVRGRYVRKAQ